MGKGQSSERKTVGWTGTGGSVGILSCKGRGRTRRGAQSRKRRGLAWRAGLQAKVMISPTEGKNTATGVDHRWETGGELSEERKLNGSYQRGEVRPDKESLL